MVANQGLLLWSIFLIIALWLGLLSIIVLRFVRHYNRLTDGVTKGGLKDILETILVSHRDSQRQISDINKTLRQVILDGKKHITKISVVRFNPFADTGGSQSFTMAILDSEDNGLIMTSLFARAGHRWYVKEVRGGKGKDFELSKEEELAIKRARSI